MEKKPSQLMIGNRKSLQSSLVEWEFPILLNKLCTFNQLKTKSADSSQISTFSSELDLNLKRNSAKSTCIRQIVPSIFQVSHCLAIKILADRRGNKGQEKVDFVRKCWNFVDRSKHNLPIF